MTSSWTIIIFFSFSLTILSLVSFADSQTSVKFLFVVESTAISINGLLNEVLPATEKKFGAELLKLDAAIVEVDRDNIEASQQKVCAALFEGVTLILDMTWTGWDNLEKLARDHSILYRRTDSAITPFIQAMDDLLTKKNATDVALIFENERDLNQSLYYLIGHSIIRLVVIDELSDATVAKVRAMRPSPSYYAIYAKTSNMETLFQTALDGGLVKRNGVWNLVFTDLAYKNFNYIATDKNLNITLGVLSMRPDVCCRLIDENPCSCPSNFEIFPNYFKRLMALFVSSFAEMVKSGKIPEKKSAKCDVKTTNVQNASTLIAEAFSASLVSANTALNNVIDLDDPTMMYYKIDIELETLHSGKLQQLGDWSRERRIQVAEGQKITPAKRYFRVGTTEAVPWTSLKRDPITNLPLKDAEGNEIWEGYCIDFIQKLSEEMDFEYDLVIPADRAFGNKLPDGKWTGLVGDLARGETDIVLSALTMTSEREEVIDFVAPYFAQSGILIGIIK